MSFHRLPGLLVGGVPPRQTNPEASYHDDETSHNTTCKMSYYGYMKWLDDILTTHSLFLTPSHTHTLTPSHHHTHAPSPGVASFVLNDRLFPVPLHSAAAREGGEEEECPVCLDRPGRDPSPSRYIRCVCVSHLDIPIVEIIRI